MLWGAAKDSPYLPAAPAARGASDGADPKAEAVMSQDAQETLAGQGADRISQGCSSLNAASALSPLIYFLSTLFTLCLLLSLH